MRRASRLARRDIGSTSRSTRSSRPSRKKGTHGTEFHYRTPNVDVVGWLIARVTGKSPAAVLSERLWSRIGAEDDAFLQVDADGSAARRQLVECATARPCALR